VTGWKSIEGELALEVARIAAAPGSVGKRAHALLEALHRRVPFDAHWLGLLDLDAHQYVSVASGGIDERSLRYLEGPEFVSDVELVGRHPTRPVVCNRKFPVPWQEVRVWADYHWPAGFREGLGLRLFSPDSRYLGALGLLTDTTAHPTDQALTMIGWLAPMIAAALDPLRALGTLARIVADADAGVVLTRGGSTLDLPGLPRHPVLAPASPVLAVAAERLAEGTEYTRFLAPQPGPEGGWLRITALAAPTDVPIQLAGIVVASSAGRLHGLTRRELEVLGLLVEGWTNARIAAELGVAQRTVAAHLEHVLAKLRAPTRALAAARAHRDGAYIPRPLRLGR
jgi:DNA-binding CsgD family transcriptional regulator